MKALHDVEALASAVCSYAESRWAANSVELASEGTEYYLFRVLTNRGPVAVKCSAEAVISDDIDDEIDTSRSLEREASVLMHLRSRGVSVPECFGYAHAGRFPLCAMEYVEGDGTTATESSVGQALREVHDAGVWPVPAMSFTEMETNFKLTLLQRTSVWLNKLVSQRELDISLVAAIQPRCFGSYKIPSLTTLHLDLRHPNIVARNGRVAALLDWGNSMIGDPWLDLLRVEEFAQLDVARFLAGYGDTPVRPPVAVEHLYRLYSTSMLSLLFKNMVPDQERQRLALKRTRDSLLILRDIFRGSPVE